MRPAKFEYFAPTDLEEAARMLASGDGGGRILAGGQSLMPALNLRLAKPDFVVDLSRVPGLSDITVEADRVRMGAMVTHADIITSEALHARLPVFRMAGMHIAHSTIREHGTIGGSLALADPASEWPAILVLLRGRVRATSVRGERWIEADAFIVSFYTTALEPDEILTQVEFPLPAAKVRYAFEEFSRQHGAFAIALAAVAATLKPDGSVGAMEVVVGGCASRPARLGFPALPAADQIRGRVDAAFDAAGLKPTTDIHASSEDRRDIAAALVRKCIARVSQAAG